MSSISDKSESDSLSEEVAAQQEEMLADLGGVEIVYTPLDADEIPDEVKANLEPVADKGRRLVVARNMVPMPPRIMGPTLYALMGDSVPAIREAAEDSFDDLPPNIVRTLAGLPVPAKILDYIARNSFSADDPDKILETVLLNKATGVDTLLLLTRIASPGLLTIISNNQTRIQQNPQIISEFPKNPRCTIAILSRVLEFGRRQKLVTVEQENRLIDEFLGKAEPEEVVVEKVVTEVTTEEGETDWEFPAFMTNDFEADMELDAEADAIEQKISAKLNMRDYVRKLSVPQKMRLAVRGNMEARKILIMDTLGLVAKEVLKSPRLTKTEVENAAESRMVDQEILEAIAKSAPFTRTYAVRHALVTNPKTPLRYANKLLSTLMEKDIRALSKSKSVSQAIQNIARQKIEAQEIRRKKREQKKKKK